MKAIVQTQYGGPEILQIKEMEKPQPKATEVLIKIQASPVTAADGFLRRGEPRLGRLYLGLRKPKNPIPGTGFAGVIEAVGKDVKEFQVGDQVFGETAWGFGTHSEYVCVPEEGILAKKPSNISFEEAAPICDGPLTSMNFLKLMADVQPGQRVLINGASGSLGTAAVQLAKHLGAEVTGVCGPKNVEFVKSLGADHVIDYSTTDFTKTGHTYHYIYDTVGKSSYRRSKRALTPNGAYLSPVLNFPLLFQMIWTSLFSKKKAKFSATGTRPASELRPLLLELRDLLASGQLKSVIDRRFPFENIADAHRYVDTGHKRGNVVITH